MPENQITTSDYEAPFLEALKHYPELQGITIEPVVKNNPLFYYAARPAINSVLKPRLKRKYFLVIAKKTKEPLEENALLKNLPFDAQVGILGHELAHTADYTKRNLLSLLLFSLLYPIPYFRRRIERATDLSAVAHGLGKELYLF